MPGAENMIKIIYRGHVDAIIKNKDSDEKYIFEAKHTRGFQNQDKMIQYYMPQIQFYLALCSHETNKLIFQQHMVMIFKYRLLNTITLM